jgi:hypothetical protein
VLVLHSNSVVKIERMSGLLVFIRQYKDEREREKKKRRIVWCVVVVTIKKHRQSKGIL